jgi:hypothetical protein
MSWPLSSSRSNAYRNTRPSWPRYRSRSNTGSPWPSQATASPSIRNERARSAPASSAIRGNRPVRSWPLRVSRRTPAGSRRTIMRKPSSLISWIQSGPEGGRSAGEGRQGSINADTRMWGFFRAPADGVKPHSGPQKPAQSVSGLAPRAARGILSRGSSRQVVALGSRSIPTPQRGPRVLSSWAGAPCRPAEVFDEIPQSESPPLRGLSFCSVLTGPPAASPMVRRGIAGAKLRHC